VATIYPDAEFDEIGGREQARRMHDHDIVCLHTMAVEFDVVDRNVHQDGYGGIGAHFGVTGDGRVKQWRDLDFRSQANLDGNHRVISIETADTGAPFPDWDHDGSDVPAWSDAQIDAIVDLVGWLCDHFDIPKDLIPDSLPGRRGVAYHRLGIRGDFPPPFTGLVAGGEVWSGSTGKVCPGDRRITQIHDVIMPGLHGGAELFPALDREQQREVLRLARKLDARDKKTFPDVSGDGRLREVVVAGRALLGSSSAVSLGADAGPRISGLVNGAILDGLRRPSADRPDRGALRGPFKAVFRAALTRPTEGEIDVRDIRDGELHVVDLDVDGVAVGDPIDVTEDDG
jgi:hypothetical protein